ncbi:MAG: SMC-Scp complex subunit ScpB [Anaerolineae bacterium]
MSIDVERMEDGQDIARRVVALLFVADGPVTAEQLAQALGVAAEEVSEALDEVEARLASCGLRLQRHGTKLQIATAPDVAAYVERLLGLDLASRLSPAAVEVLAIIAYRQPLARSEIEAIRGVNCDSVLRTLCSKGLVAEVGRLEQAGRPILYGTTFEFLQYFGLHQVADLPPLVPTRPPTTDLQQTA